MGFLTYAVEIEDGARLRWVGDFRTLEDAIQAANHAAGGPRVRMAIVKHNESGVMVYSTDGLRQWSKETAHA